MTQTETAIAIASCVLILFAAPFFILLVDAIATDNQRVMPSLSIVGFSMTFFCLLVLVIGVWLDGFSN